MEQRGQRVWTRSGHRAPVRSVAGLAVVISLIFVAGARAVTVQTDCGSVNGDISHGNVFTFQGIPFAVPPTGNMRYKPSILLSEANQCWNGTFQAISPGRVCPQNGVMGLYSSEDCLFLNVWTPNVSLSENELLPVVFYIYGGSLVEGSGDVALTVPWIFAQNGIVSVSANYRLNALGFLSLRALRANDPRGVSGNYGFTDQIAALKWIRANIRNFGGDPSRVTIYGQSSGGSSVLALMQAPSAAGLFSAVISMSGAANITFTLEEGESYMQSEYLPVSPCANVSGDDTLLYECLMNAKAEDLMHAYNDSLWNPAWYFGIPYPNSTIAPLALVDGVTISQSSFTAPPVNDVALILGNMQEESDISPMDVVDGMTVDEYTAFLKQRLEALSLGLAAETLELYPTASFASQQQSYDQISSDSIIICGTLALASFLSKNMRSPVYNYIADVVPPFPLCLGGSYCARYSFHALDLFLLDDNFVPLFGDIKKFHNNFLSAFVEFAATRNISQPGWRAFSDNQAFPAGYWTTMLGPSVELVNATRADKCAMWVRHGLTKFWWQE